MNRKLFDIALKKEVVVCSLFLTSYFLFLLFDGYDFTLTAYSKIQIGQATLDGIDISKRVSLFYKVATLFAILITIICIGLNKLRAQFQISSRTLTELSIFSTTGFFLILASVMGIDSRSVVHLSFFLFLFFIILHIFKPYIKELKILSNGTFFGRILTISIIFLSIIIFLFNSNSLVINNSPLILIFIVLCLMFVTFILKKYSQKTTTNFFLFLLPLCLAPIFLLLSTELLFYFKIKSNVFISYKWTFISLLAISFLIFTVYSLIKPINIPSKKLFANYYAPSALLSFILLTLYTPIIEQPQDLFELANPAIAQMRIFSFNEIPFLDFMSSHMFSEQFYGIIYHFIHGHSGDLSFLTYKFLYEAIIYFLGYYFLIRLVKSPFLAILFLITFPFIDLLLDHHLFYSIVVFFIIRKTTSSQTINNFLLLAFAVIFMCFWRLDVGASTLATTFLFFPVYLFIKKQKIAVSPLLKSIGIFILAGTVIISLAVGVKSTEYLLNNISSTLHYISANQAHGYSIIAYSFDQQFFIYHIILPFISILIMLYIVYFLRKKSDKYVELVLSSSLFLFLIYIINFQRGIVRHGFMEETDSFLMATFFIALSLFLLSFIKDKQPIWRFISFFSITFSVIIFLKFFPIDKEVNSLNTLLNSSPIVNLDQNFNNEKFNGRVVKNDDFSNQNYNNIKLFLDENLSNEQTLLDFSNTPMLYYYCTRTVPSYFCQNLQNSVDDYLQLEQLKKVSPSKTPVVIYSNYPQTWWDNTDGVPNSMRQHLIAEYIYTNYKPYRVINNRSVWIAKNLTYETAIETRDTLIGLPETHNYKYSAHLISKFYTSQKNKLVKKINTVKTPFKTEESFSVVNIDSSISCSSGVFVKITLENVTEEKEIDLQFFKDNGKISSNIFTTKLNELEYMLPVSNHYLWFKEHAKYLKIKKNSSYAIKTIEFYKDIRI